MKNPYSLKRNDVEGALEVWREAVREGRVAEVGQVLLMLQDDPRELLDRVAAEQKKTDRSSEPR